MIRKKNSKKRVKVLKYADFLNHSQGRVRVDRRAIATSTFVKVATHEQGAGKDAPLKATADKGASNKTGAGKGCSAQGVAKEKDAL